MNKQKLIIRIIAGILLIVMVLGMIIPYVSASEIDGNEQYGDLGGNPDTLPPFSLPIGFEYVPIGDNWRIAKTNDNTKPAMMLDGRHDGFDATTVSVFVGNLETYEVKKYDLYYESNYVASMDLPDGYYVLFSNYAWCDSDGKAFAVNGGNYYYFYVGSDYDHRLYPIEFKTGDEIFSLALGGARQDMQKIPQNSSLTITADQVQFPEDAKLKKTTDPQDPVVDPTQPGITDPIESQPPVVTPPEEPEDPVMSVLQPLIDGVKKSALMIIALVGCYVGLTLIKMKKRAEIAKQVETDSYDDKRIE